jgi:hypothetical protein
MQSDRGGGYISQEFKEYLRNEGIAQRLTMSSMPQQNAVSERLNQQLLTIMRCILLQANAPPVFWGEALEISMYIKNRRKCSSIGGKVRIELWTGESLDKDELLRMRTFGCLAWAHIDPPTKLSPRVCKCIMLGYPREGV